jgi:type II secretory pathway pseudopilin PulG
MIRVRCLPRVPQSSPLVARRGITATEILVTIAIIGLLLALILPAVQSARESSRRVTCRNNLRQVALAANQFHAVHKKFPDDIFHLRSLLPYLGQQALYEEVIKKDYSCADVLGAVPVLICPTDPDADVAKNHTCYWINSGTYLTTRDPNGFFVGRMQQPYELRGARADQVRDGLSNTVMYSERMTMPSVSNFRTAEQFEAYSRKYEKRFIWWPKRTYYGGSIGGHLDRECQIAENRVTAFVPNPSYHRAFCPSAGIYNHVSGPNTFGCFRDGVDTMPPPRLGSLRLGAASVPATSAHAAGVHVAMGDGSVRFVSDSISHDVWQAHGTVAGGETIDSF